MKYQCRTRDQRSGAVAVLAAFFMIVFLGLVAFGIDCGVITLARTQLQNAADAGAIAGADSLASGTSAATTAAQTFAQSNYVAGNPVSIVAAQDVELGTWNKTSLTFTPLSGSAQSGANAVRVTCRVSAARGNSLSLFFAKAFGNSSADLSAQSVATASSINCGPFVGLNKVDMSGSAYTDSYDSSQGAYSAAGAGNGGHVCSNGRISMSGSATVNGDAHPGTSSNLSMSGSASVSGSTTRLTQALNEPAINMGNVATSNNNNLVPLSANNKTPLDNKRNFSLSGGDSVTLPAGTYYFAKFQLSGGSSVALSGQTIIYCTDQVDLSGGTILNPSTRPADCQLYCTGDQVSLSGSSSFYGAVYAPTADVSRSGSSDFYGMIIGKTLSLSGQGGLHYDTSLGVLSGGQQQAQLVQ
jgi:Flp pilus assembly protein TadG